MKVWRRNKCFGKLKVSTGLSQNTGKYSIQLLKHHHHYHNVDDHTCDVAPDRALQKTSLVPPILSTCGGFFTDYDEDGLGEFDEDGFDGNVCGEQPPASSALGASSLS